MEDKIKDLMEKAERPGKIAPQLHKFYGGKIETIPKCFIKSLNDFDIWYTPGVASVSRLIAQDRDLSFEYTNRWNTIAVVTDGSRVLGLGDIGPEASLPVMEGKALLFKYLGGVDAFPLAVKEKDPDRIISILEAIQPSIGGVNLEDIEKPKCFYILEEARRRLEIPVWHDDQQGTATVILAGIINALKIVGKKISDVKIVLFGVGAANTKAAEVLILAGADPKKMYLVDSKGVIHAGRKDIIEEERNPWKYKLAELTNPEQIEDVRDAFKDADIVVGASKPGPDTIKKDWIRLMNDDPIVFATANPIPEIWPWDAKEAGARIIATGRSDFPNQINNSLGFPGIFRGVLDVRAKTITDEMCIAAAEEIARFAEERGIHEEYIVPRMDEWEVYPRMAVAAALQSIKQGVARQKPSREELWDRAVKIISRSINAHRCLLENGYIPGYDEPNTQ